ncbi:CYTH and CHAD domain-containing protein [Streptomyces sp. PSKA54]|uniref:CYTH and CHAD domain-containing protein n=1 Tax=Streptomyces himalayensis subsp. aureolus TaxID=2758039 RepID=A0A7W2CZA6_9ACTN|nr:CYTH and CHAD domain-containing protein [Streptomyces himalayensis]MBA4861813.1 CYTH and CHAD domain-containing protein [Streptomyces himalayensis subsp. aureolus]
MAETKREIERKYEADESAQLPDLSGVAGISTVVDKGVNELDAVYYDTADERLASAAITLRRRTGGDDAGWHLKLPVDTGVRDEIRAPLSDTVPRALSGLVRSLIRDAELAPVVRLRSARDVRDLLDSDGALLAEVSIDDVRAERLGGDGDGATAGWTEIEVELADGGDPGFLDKVDKKLRKAGLRASAAPSKLARALAETAPGRSASPGREKSPGREEKKARGDGAQPSTAGDHVLAYIRAQRDALVELDPAVRRDLPDSVHQMRVATRRMRSAFRSYGKVLDRAVTRPIGDELKWLAGELGVDRDQEVLTERLTAALGELPRALHTGPVRTRLRTWSHARRGGSRRRLIAVLDGKRYLALLDAIDALLDRPPLLKAAAGQPGDVIAKAVRRDFQRLSSLVQQALDAPPGDDRDLAMHEARKEAKRTRYAAEAATAALGGPAQDLVRSMKSLQGLLGEHQDSVMARLALRDLAAEAHAAGESAFTYGLLYGREEQAAAAYEAALPGEWARIVQATRV